jgi:SAM-dependent methyltransferase
VNSGKSAGTWGSPALLVVGCHAPHVDLDELLVRPPMIPGEAGLPWGDPDFSARMLREHLDQHHDMASRREATIDGHVEWLRALAPQGTRVLDLGCGPGLYLERFARVGYNGVGIDVSPASIEYASRRAQEHQLDASYALSDFRRLEVDGEFDLILCLFGELSTVPIDDVRDVLDMASTHLNARGRVVIELSTRNGVVAKGSSPPTWYRAEGGLFAPGTHAVVSECQWFEADQASVERWWVLERGSPRPRMFGSTTWWHQDLEHVIEPLRLVVEARYGDLSGQPQDDDREFVTLVLRPT